MADSSGSWWERRGEDMTNIIFIITIALATLWAIYVWLALPFQAPVSFLIGFVAVAGYLFRGAFGRGQSSSRPSAHRPLSAKLSHLAFVVCAAMVFGSWGGGFLSLVVIVITKGGISSDCAPGVPMRYC